MECDWTSPQPQKSYLVAMNELDRSENRTGRMDHMSESESTPRSNAIVYFVVSPLEGPGYRTCEDDELQAMGGVHALERLCESHSYSQLSG